MKGAKGLLISITGGKDLLLYEVDEAATRIREEVDSDANIIVGATFDESLDGIVRVSVVATGIDVANSTRQPAPKQSQPPAQATARLAELSQTLRTNQPQQRPAVATSAPAAAADRVEQAHRAVAQALAITETAAPAEQVRAAEPPRPAETAVVEDVTIRPIVTKPSLFLEAVEDQTPAPRPPAAPAIEEPFIPPRPERAVQRPVRMPPIEEFPPHAQKQVEAQQRGKVQEPHNLETKRLSLLERLAKVSLVGKRQDEPPQAEPTREAPRPAAARAMPPMPKAPPMPPIARTEPVSEYAKRPVPRPAPQGLDQHGRPAPVNNSIEDDQLEIPAFLRRQAN
jgi:cell division protein FtsZ